MVMASYILFIYVIFIILIALNIVFYTETPSKALGYLILVISFPIVGVLIYFSVGLNYRKKGLYLKKLEIDELEFPKLEQKVQVSSQEALLRNSESIGHFHHLANFSKSKILISDNNRASLLINGENKFPDVIESLKKAKNHIHIEYYIYENDEIGNQLAQVLMAKAKEGVEVRFIYDDYGGRDIRKNIVKKLIDSGVEAHPFYKINLIMLANRLNYRNHRKIIIVDGVVGYIGGINVSDKYINSNNNQLFWRDTHLKIIGASVINLQFTFLTDWNFCANQKISFSNDYFPFEDLHTHYGNHLIQIISSGPDSKYPNIKYALIQAIVAAKSEVCITTPYFIPDRSFLDAIYIAALSGVEVKLLLPRKSDSFVVNTTTQSYFQDLLKSGVKIYTYTKGFVHAKTMVCDKKISIIGTANLDNRSFDLNFEINAVVYDENIAKELTGIFEDDLKYSKQIVFEEWVRRPFYKKLLEKVFKLFSSLM